MTHMLRVAVFGVLGVEFSFGPKPGPGESECRAASLSRHPLLTSAEPSQLRFGRQLGPSLYWNDHEGLPESCLLPGGRLFGPESWGC